MSLWCLLFFAQAYLVATHRVRVHRRLGILGAVLAFAVVAMGTYATVEATAREVQIHTVGRFHYLFGLNLVNLLLFSLFVVAALTLRTRPEFHKRLMLLATLSLLAPAVARITLLFTHGVMAQFLTLFLRLDVCCDGHSSVSTSASGVWLRRHASHRVIAPDGDGVACEMVASFRCTTIFVNIWDDS